MYPFQVGGVENVIHYTYCTKVLYLHLLDRSNIISVLWKRNQIFQNDIRWCFFFLIFNVFRTNADFTGNFEDAFVHMGFYLISDGKIPVNEQRRCKKKVHFFFVVGFAQIEYLQYTILYCLSYLTDKISNGFHSGLLTGMISTLCSYTLYTCLNVKELLARNRREIWSLSNCNYTRTDCNWTRTLNQVDVGSSLVAVTAMILIDLQKVFGIIDHNILIQKCLRSNLIF